MTSSREGARLCEICTYKRHRNRQTATKP